MSKQRRLDLIKAIEANRGTFLISYITSTRAGLEAQMAMDCVRKIYDHLRSADASSDGLKIDLFIHSNGGDGTVPWRLVTLIREYATRFSVLVPYKAFSAATLTALGADEVVMHPMGMLGPTDPTVANPFNPKNPLNGELIGISVEDVTSYIELVKEDVGIRHEDELVQAFNILAQQVHPLALGNVKRHIQQSRLTARKLLSLHMNAIKDEHRISEIVDNLTSKLFFHGHPVNRVEAKTQVGLETVCDPSPELADLMWALYLEYEQEMKMEDAFSPVDEFAAAFPVAPTPGAQPPVAPTPGVVTSVDNDVDANVASSADAFGASDSAGTVMQTVPPMPQQMIQMGQPAPQVRTAKIPATLVYVESHNRTDKFSVEIEVTGMRGPNGVIQLGNVGGNDRKWGTE